MTRSSAKISKTASGVTQKNGGTPEGVRQGKSDMETVLEARPAGKANPIEIAGYHTQSAHKKLAIWLETLVEKSKDKPIAQLVKMTPEMATMLLERNPDNRRLSERTVERYAHEIDGGRWAFNGEPIIVSDTGELNDGQHRCAAVVEAGKPIDVLLLVGIARETRTTLDQGKMRTAGDFLSMEGNVNVNVLSAASNIVWQYRNRGQISQGGKNGGATKGEILDFVRANPGIVRSVAYVHEKGADAAGGKSVLAASHFILTEQSREDADYFIISMIRGAGLKVGDPILYVRNRLINEHRQLRQPERMELIFKGWNAWRKREKPSRIVITGGLLPVLEA